MLQPKRTKYRKMHKGRNDGLAFVRQQRQLRRIRPEGDHPRPADRRARSRRHAAASRATSSAAARCGSACSRTSRSRKKPIEVRMGTGKGNVEFWVAPIQPGRMMYEIEGVTEADGPRGIPPGRRQAVGADPIRCPDGAVMELNELRNEVGATS